LRKDVMCVIKLCKFNLVFINSYFFIEDMENKVIINKINEKFKWFVGFNDEGNFLRRVCSLKKVKSGEISKYNVGYAYHFKRDILRRALL